MSLSSFERKDKSGVNIPQDDLTDGTHGLDMASREDMTERTWSLREMLLEDTPTTLRGTCRPKDKLDKLPAWEATPESRRPLGPAKQAWPKQQKTTTYLWHKPHLSQRKGKPKGGKKCDVQGKGQPRGGESTTSKGRDDLVRKKEGKND